MSTPTCSYNIQGFIKIRKQGRLEIKIKRGKKRRS
jgi:hypothetical protein